MYNLSALLFMFPKVLKTLYDYQEVGKLLKIYPLVKVQTM